MDILHRSISADSFVFWEMCFPRADYVRMRLLTAAHWWPSAAQEISGEVEQLTDSLGLLAAEELNRQLFLLELRTRALFDVASVASPGYLLAHGWRLGVLRETWRGFFAAVRETGGLMESQADYAEARLDARCALRENYIPAIDREEFPELSRLAERRSAQRFYHYWQAEGMQHDYFDSMYEAAHDGRDIARITRPDLRIATLLLDRARHEETLERERYAPAPAERPDPEATEDMLIAYADLEAGLDKLHVPEHLRRMIEARMEDPSLELQLRDTARRLGVSQNQLECDRKAVEPGGALERKLRAVFADYEQKRRAPKR